MEIIFRDLKHTYSILLTDSEVLITHKERPPEEKVLIAAVCPPSGPFTL